MRLFHVSISYLALLSVAIIVDVLVVTAFGRHRGRMRTVWPARRPSGSPRPRTLAAARGPRSAGGAAGWVAPSSGRSDAGPRTDQSSRAVNAVISAAPSMCTQHQRDGRSVKYCTKPISALGQLDDEQDARPPGGPGPAAPVACRATSSATVSPISRNTRSACSWLTSAGRARCAPALGRRRAGRCR